MTSSPKSFTNTSEEAKTKYQSNVSSLKALLTQSNRFNMPSPPYSQSSQQ